MSNETELPGSLNYPEQAALRHIAGATEPWTVNLLTAYVRAARPKVVIDCGSFSGDVAFALGRAMGDEGGVGYLTTVEMDADRCTMLQQRINDTPFFGVGISLVRGDALNFLASVPDDSVDMVFLDDDHSPIHVDRELREVKRILRVGGACFIHDVMSLFGLKPVILKHGGVCLDLVRFHPSGGLGIVTK